MSKTVTVYRSGLSLGFIIAVLCSWERNHDIVLAILHGILSWFYVAYVALTGIQ